MIVYSSQYHRKHDTAGITLNGSPFISEEVPERVDCLLQAVSGLNAAEIHQPLDYGMHPLLAVHDPDFVHFLQTIYSTNAAYAGAAAPVFPGTFAPVLTRRRSSHPEGLPGYYCYGTYTPILEGTWQAAYWSAQCAINAASELLDGQRAAYALCRPPGHHAARALYGGFCYLNNAAIAARFLQSQAQDAYGNNTAARIAILDIDYHHGNGTQEIFYTDPSVLVCSIHAHPDQDYPYFWGAVDECGADAGRGSNYNWPLPRGAGENTYLKALDEALVIIAKYAPSYLVVSLGFDTGEGDPAGGFCLTSHSFTEIAWRIKSLGPPLVFVQEGGYHLERLQEWAAAFFQPFDS